jgi:pilus assembly protein CpaB
MNQRVIAVLIFALIVASGATLLFYRVFAARLNAPSKQASTKVVVAARKLDVGTLIKDSDLTISDWGAALPPQAVQKKEDLVGRGVIEPVYLGEPVLESRLAPKGAGAGLAAIIPPGMRAVAIRVNDIIGVAGFVSPGMHVDVLISGNPPDAAPSLGRVSKTLLQNVEVLSAGKSTQRDAEGKPVSVPVINLKVTPEQAETLSLAAAEARLQLVLRNPLDTEVSQTPGTSVANLYTGMRGLAPPPKPVGPRVVRAAPPAPKEAPPAMIEVINGDKLETVKLKRESED